MPHLLASLAFVIALIDAITIDENVFFRCHQHAISSSMVLSLSLSNSLKRTPSLPYYPTLSFLPMDAPLCSDVLVRSGFQSLQIIITDYLPSYPTVCVPTCVEVAGYYGLQAQDINVSLTSIGLLVGVAQGSGFLWV